MPREIVEALPHMERLLSAWKVRTLICPGYEGDDIIGTLVRRGGRRGFTCTMVTPDKDLEQLVSERVFLLKPSAAGGGGEIFGLTEVCARWGIQRPEQLTDVLGLWGDAADGIPGVPGIGVKTARRLIGSYGGIGNLLIHLDDLKGRLRENLAAFQDQALLSKRLATIDRAVPLRVSMLEASRQSDHRSRKVQEGSEGSIGGRAKVQKVQEGSVSPWFNPSHLRASAGKSCLPTRPGR